MTCVTCVVCHDTDVFCHLCHDHHSCDDVLITVVTQRGRGGGVIGAIMTKGRLLTPCG